MSEVRPFSSSGAAAGHAGDGESSLVDALNQNKAVQEKMEGVGDELLIVNTVLKQELPETLQTGDVAQALEKHEELESMVQECVDDLADVNEALEEEVVKRRRLERQLAQSQAELAQGRSKDSG